MEGKFGKRQQKLHKVKAFFKQNNKKTLKPVAEADVCAINRMQSCKIVNIVGPVSKTRKGFSKTLIFHFFRFFFIFKNDAENRDTPCV